MGSRQGRPCGACWRRAKKGTEQSRAREVRGRSPMERQRGSAGVWEEGGGAPGFMAVAIRDLVSREWREDDSQEKEDKVFYFAHSRLAHVLIRMERKQTLSQHIKVAWTAEDYFAHGLLGHVIEWREWTGRHIRLCFSNGDDSKLSMKYFSFYFLWGMKYFSCFFISPKLILKVF